MCFYSSSLAGDLKRKMASNHQRRTLVRHLEEREAETREKRYETERKREREREMQEYIHYTLKRVPIPG